MLFLEYCLPLNLYTFPIPIYIFLFLFSVQKEDYTEVDALVICLLTHGGNGYVDMTDDKMEINDILGYFKKDVCRSLVGKPKLLFVQVSNFKNQSIMPILVRWCIPLGIYINPLNAGNNCDNVHIAITHLKTHF